MDFLDILMEAKGDKPRARKLKVDQKDVEKDSTDYTGEEDPSASDDDDAVADDGGDETDTDTGDEDSTDYTEEDVDVDPQDGGGTDDTGGDDGADAGDGTDDGGDGTEGGDEATDYTDETGDDGGEDSGDDAESSEEAPAEDESEATNQRILLGDFISLYYLTKNTIMKLSGVNNSNILVNRIISQITSNLNILKKHLFDYIVFNFPKGKYVTNLYKYNLFLEALKVNMQMLEKIKVFVPINKTNI